MGYTGIRIRGSDATRINVTLNGIPYNDAESQGTFFVNLPDIASSVNSIQVQRGVGTSSNGAGAFGASINLSTNEVSDSMYVELNNSFGSFNTRKNTVRFGSGIIGKHFTVDGRFSRISSDGFVDRASSNLKSFYVSTAWLNKKNSLRLNIFSGKEKTYQSWNGIPERYLKTNRRYNSAGQDRPGGPYDNETDNYTQTHYQLFYNHEFNSYWKANVAVFLTRGAGYYEQYKADEKLSKYGLPQYIVGTDTTRKTDIIRQLWLDNNFYGSIFSIQHKKNNTQVTIGGGLNQYDGKHYGKIVWAQTQAAVPLNYRWYNLKAKKQDLNLYAKWTEQLSGHWQSFVDVQFRNVQYDINGFRNNPSIKTNNTYHFLNPKVGITYTNNNWQAFLSYARAAKEPNRDDFEAGLAVRPKAEKLDDFELGVERKSAKSSLAANVFFMKYKDQLVLVGNINDVGAYTRTNIPNSYRAGIELQGKTILTNWVNLAANISFSENKIKNYTELVDDYDNGGTKAFYYNSTNIAFSPAVVAGSSLNFVPIKNAEISFLSKYEGDVRISYTLFGKIFKETNLIVQLNNVFNKKYEANGYTSSYISGGLTTENYYFPMAPLNCMVGLNVRF